MDAHDGVFVPVPTVGNPDFVPVYMTKEAAGADLMAAIPESLVLQPGASLLVPTGIRVAIPEGFELQIRPRSGLALKHQVTVLNTPGTIDSDYRGQVQVILINHGKNPFVIEPGMRIGQAVLARVYRAEFVLCEDLHATARGDGGFGHTATFLISSQNSAERDKARSKPRGLTEEAMAKAIADEEDRSSKVAAERIPDEMRKIAGHTALSAKNPMPTHSFT